MGLDFSHGDAHFSYGGFAEFRIRLAQEIGLDLHAMEGFTDSHRNTNRNRKPLSWTKVKDAIVPLLNHSDCDGELTVEECLTVAPRLRELVNDWPEDDWDRKRAFELADAMEEAAKANESLEFQ